MKTRGPNPNPTAKAQSKCCLPLSTKTCNLIEIALLRAPTFRGGWYLFVIIPEKLLTGADARVPNLMCTECAHNVHKMCINVHKMCTLCLFWGRLGLPRDYPCASLWRLCRLLWNPLGSPGELGMTLDHYITIMSPCARNNMYVHISYIHIYICSPR